MKKITGFLGCSLVVAISFFNMSSIIDINQNVDLNSIVQSATAQDENSQNVDSKLETTYTSTTNVVIDGEECEVKTKSEKVECFGTGTTACTPKDEVVGDPIVKC